MRQISKVVAVAIVLAMGACSSDDDDDDSNAGSPNAGSSGSSSAGIGGKGGSGGKSAGGSGGGSSGSAGKASGGTGGSGAGAGGSTAGSGGSGQSGAGAGGAGGSAGAAGSTGGNAGNGGNEGEAGGTGGSGGEAGAGGGVMPKAGMNFFVTSEGMPTGGNLGSVEDADAFCKNLATAVSADLGAKAWRAYLSTTSEDARDRIGTGPWRNQAGIVIANNVTDLHAQESGEALDDTWPPGDLGIALTETGDEVVNADHDILTGSNADGTLFEDNNCNDWTSQSADDTAGVGHSNRTGGGRPPYFNATHAVGCAPFTENYEDGTVSQGGGRGSLYCFALEPSPEP